ncbi:hypothetical protein COCSADRAFT_313827 [Bipolaris sorokiniana ND90Pr]|uniref:Uncharacterized protein n=1 Tax=Cochliobolus sativus (strain ND90Pr / ATCC 201652) TaxID=665912 RepID=M2T6X2_COCSN|nr:uncharacterized protein COCSADRAFT_313827 [Bipolaris sorokiniana ND90Pr]EMD64717.1 hypothetical protein COCSADRAFT_313827 [Bipolaris sorokiniana ND90Pr]
MIVFSLPIATFAYSSYFLGLGSVLRSCEQRSWVVSMDIAGSVLLYFAFDSGWVDGSGVGNGCRGESAVQQG